MINSLNPAAMQAQGVNVQNNVKAAPAMINPMSVPAPVQTQDLNGLDALAGYNQPLKPAKFEITPALPTVLQPEAIRVIKGERVTDSTGKLNSIIDKNDKTTVIYQMDENAPNDAISKIITLDNATGNIIRAQENTNEIKQGKMPVIKEILIREYTPNGDLAKVTEYDNENNYFVQQHEKMNDGSKKMYCVSKHSSYVTEEDANGNRVKTTQFTPSGQIGEVVYFDNDNETQVVTYKNGIPAKIENKNLETFNPELAKIPAQDREIIPAQPYVLGYAPQDVQGEKTFYSNGMVQDITTNTANGKVVHSFTAAGQLSAISIEENGTKKLVQYNNMGGEKLYSITESLGNNIDKTTTFTKDGSKNVIIENHSTEETRHAEYSKTGNLVWYSAHNPKVEEHFAIGFDETGKIQSVF